MQKDISSCYLLPYLFNTYILCSLRSASNPYTYLEPRDSRPMNIITDKHNMLDEPLLQNLLLNLIQADSLYKIVAKVISCQKIFFGWKGSESELLVLFQYQKSSFKKPIFKWEFWFFFNHFIIYVPLYQCRNFNLGGFQKLLKRIEIPLLILRT